MTRVKYIGESGIHLSTNQGYRREYTFSSSGETQDMQLEDATKLLSQHPTQFKGEEPAKKTPTAPAPAEQVKVEISAQKRKVK